VILVGLSLLSKIKAFAITDITVSGNSVVETDAIKQIAQSDLSGNYLHLFSRSDFLIYPRRRITRDIMDSSLRVSSVHVSLVGRHTIAIVVTEREPKFIWCGIEMPTDTAAQQCYFLDESGFAFAQAPYFSGDIYFKFYGPFGDAQGTPLGAQFLDPATVTSVYEASQSFHDFGWKPYALAAKDNGDYELSIESQGKDPSAYPKILFRNGNDFAKIKDNLVAAIAVEPFATKIKKDFTNLEYIDLRYDNKVYYKFND
jgi:cell division septal protein FtsQ